MNTESNKKVYLTFQTDKKTSDYLKIIAGIYKMTQPQLINEICQDHIKNVIEYAKEKAPEVSEMFQEESIK